MKYSKLTLAIETSGRTGSVAIGANGECIAEKPFSGFMKHSAELLPAVNQLLSDAAASPADIAQVFIAAGPGSFTGLRIAVTAAKMFNLAQKTQIVTLDSLDVIAENVTKTDLSRITVVLDAKKDYFYAASYARTSAGWEKDFGTEMITARDLLDRMAQYNEDIGVLGEALVYNRSKLDSSFTRLLQSEYWQPHARNLFRLGKQKADRGLFADPLTLIPTYIRKPDAVAKIRPAAITY
jgi:tRNA threonylcarbamoyladenosine biosynthesis protein TsaB